MGIKVALTLLHLANPGLGTFIQSAAGEGAVSSPYDFHQLRPLASLLLASHPASASFNPVASGLQSSVGIRFGTAGEVRSVMEDSKGELVSLQGALGRVAGGGVLGVGAGSLAHAALKQWTVLGSAAFAPFDPFLNLLDLGLGGQCGLVLGGLWASEAALLTSGVIQGSVQQALGVVLKEEDDVKAGERTLRTIREGLNTLIEKGGWPVRLALFLSGLNDDPAVSRLIEEAQAKRVNARQRPFSEIIALVFESTLQARLDDTRFFILGLTCFIAAVVQAPLYFFGSAVISAFSGGR